VRRRSTVTRLDPAPCSIMARRGMDRPDLYDDAHDADEAACAEDPRPPTDPQLAFTELGTVILGAQPLERVLEQVAWLALRTLPGADEVSVTLIEGDRPRSAAFTGPLAMALDERQYQAGFGPCLDAAITGDTVTIDDTAHEEVYRDFARHARAQHVTATLSVGLPIPQRVIGALNIYGTRGRSFDADSARLAETFAGYAAVALANAALYQSTVDLAENLQQAMHSRAVIEQAKGILMGQNRCTPDAAFAMLSNVSQRENRKLRDVARTIVARVAHGPHG
jgi:transcriptional regulator with GAF, ATPase, and Fis domain